MNGGYIKKTLFLAFITSLTFASKATYAMQQEAKTEVEDDGEIQIISSNVEANAAKKRKVEIRRQRKGLPVVKIEPGLEPVVKQEPSVESKATQENAPSNNLLSSSSQALIPVIPSHVQIVKPRSEYKSHEEYFAAMLECISMQIARAQHTGSQELRQQLEELKTLFQQDLTTELEKQKNHLTAQLSSQHEATIQQLKEQHEAALLAQQQSANGQITALKSTLLQIGEERKQLQEQEQKLQKQLQNNQQALMQASQELREQQNASQEQTQKLHADIQALRKQEATLHQTLTKNQQESKALQEKSQTLQAQANKQVQDLNASLAQLREQKQQTDQQIQALNQASQNLKLQKEHSDKELKQYQEALAKAQPQAFNTIKNMIKTIMIGSPFILDNILPISIPLLITAAASGSLFYYRNHPKIAGFIEQASMFATPFLSGFFNQQAQQDAPQQEASQENQAQK